MTLISCMRLCAAGALVALLHTACVTTEPPETIPPQVRDTFEALPTETDASVRVTPAPEGEQLNVNMGSMTYSLNRLFSHMVNEMAAEKFGTVYAAAPNELKVVIEYLNVEERRYSGNTYLHRIEMEVDVEMVVGEETVRRTFTEQVESDLEGYSIRTDQIYNMLLQHVLSIEEAIDEVYAGS